jgi:hypothetical protein
LTAERVIMPKKEWASNSPYRVWSFVILCV